MLLRRLYSPTLGYLCYVILINPVGRCFTRGELINIADICTRHDLIICADEIHCDILLDQFSYLPIATLSPEIAKRCIMLMAPSKTW